MGVGISCQSGQVARGWGGSHYVVRLVLTWYYLRTAKHGADYGRVPPTQSGLVAYTIQLRER